MRKTPAPSQHTEKSSPPNFSKLNLVRCLHYDKKLRLRAKKILTQGVFELQLKPTTWRQEWGNNLSQRKNQNKNLTEGGRWLQRSLSSSRDFIKVRHIQQLKRARWSWALRRIVFTTKCCSSGTKESKATRLLWRDSKASEQPMIIFRRCIKLIVHIISY